jgi:hypothetical protein
MRDGEFQRPRELAADPVQGIEARAAAGVFTPHLTHHYFGIRVDVQLGGFEGQGTLQGFEQCDVFGYVVVLVSDPAGDLDSGRSFGAFNYDTNTGRPRVSMGAAIHVGYETGHPYFSVHLKMRRTVFAVKTIIWFPPVDFREAQSVEGVVENSGRISLISGNQ